MKGRRRQASYDGRMRHSCCSVQEVLADKSAMADGHQLSQKDHNVVIEKEKQAVLLEEGARRTVKEALSRLKVGCQLCSHQTGNAFAKQ